MEFGYDNLDKDGYFIGRKFNSIDISDDFVLDLDLILDSPLIKRVHKSL